ncbi:hypothetical protein JCM10212_003574, partial [Sporobolomyces blumeae]
AILFQIVSTPSAHKKLVAELDETFAGRDMSGVLEWEDVKGLKYLGACISEGLRRHSTSGIGLPRIMMEDTECLGEVFKKGTILSVPSYTIHHSTEFWGPDAEAYKPERWLESEEQTRKLEKMLNTFSYGPRGCVGKNVAMIELYCFLATLCYRYDFKLADERQTELEVVEGFLRKPTGFKVGVKLREAAQ